MGPPPEVSLRYTVLRYMFSGASLAPSAAQVSRQARPAPRPPPTINRVLLCASHMPGGWWRMTFSHQISVAEQRARLDCGAVSHIKELDSALDELISEADFDRSFDLLVELGADEAILEGMHALAVADAFGSRRGRLQGRIALYAPGERGRAAALFIATVGRHQGLRMEAFGERAWAEQWLGGAVGRSA